MKYRTPIILCALVLLPAAVVAILGYRLVRSQEDALAVRMEGVLQDRLRDQAEQIIRILEARETEFRRLEPDSPSVENLRLLLRDRPDLAGILAFDADGGRLFPPQDDDRCTRAEREFVSSLGSLAEDGGIALRPGAGPSTQPKPSRNASLRGSLSQRRIAYDVDTIGQSEDAGTPAWLVRFRDEGIRLLFRYRTTDGVTLAFEPDRARLLADVVASLPDTPTQTAPKRRAAPDSEGAFRIVLRDARRQILYQWGPYEPEAKTPPLAATPLEYPLNAWELAYYGAPDTLARLAMKGARRVALAAGVTAMTVMLAVLAVVLYRESARRMEEAAGRVTFVNRVSHELKTPLTNIRMYAELLEESLEEDESRQREYVDVINGESARLSRLIANVLSFSGKEKGTLTVRPVPTDADALIREQAERHRHAFDRKGMRIELNLAIGRPVQADPDALEQIVVNLFSNVEKYAGEDTVMTVTGECPGPRAVIRVSDTGPGIPDALRERVFRPFFRIDNRLTEGVSGTGIGLSIARELAEIQGGTLKALPVAKGACFELTLPCANT